MTCNISTFVTYTCAFFFFSFLAVHYAHMKTPAHSRQMASYEFKLNKRPSYDASFKY